MVHDQSREATFHSSCSCRPLQVGIPSYFTSIPLTSSSHAAQPGRTSMMMMIDSGDALTDCPYDSTHVVSTRCLSKHLIKCRENHKGHRKVACKFDKTHLVPAPELPHHQSICPGRYLLDRELQLKASEGVNGVLSGDVKGPQITSKYVDNDEEDWDSALGYGAPTAYFNRKEMYLKNDKPFIVSDENYRNETSRSEQSLEEKTCRKIPFTSSKAAKISETTVKPSQLNTGNPVYLFSVAQSTNRGWGRGRGENLIQAMNSVGIVKPLAQSSIYPQGSTGAAGNSHSMSIPQSSGVAVERYSSDYSQLPGREFDNNHHSNLHHQAQPGNTNLVQSHPTHEKQTVSAGRHKNLPSSQNTVTQMSQGQPEAPILPAGRGFTHGLERLRPPASSSYAQAFSSQLNSWQISDSVRDSQKAVKDDSYYTNIIKGSNYRKVSDVARTGDSNLYELDSGSDQHSNSDAEDNSPMDMDREYTREELQKLKKKLEKKLKQIRILEQRLSNGEKLNKEEESKLQKKNETVILTEKISKLLLDYVDTEYIKPPAESFATEP